jgi:hypothetical protein
MPPPRGHRYNAEPEVKHHAMDVKAAHDEMTDNPVVIWISYAAPFGAASGAYVHPVAGE